VHHLGFAAANIGTVGTTRWADWLDLVTPYAVLLPAGLALASARASPAQWGLFAVGVITYTEGHGIHLAANSVGNVSPSPTAHLWDEVVGHYLWYTGVALIMVCLAATLGPLAPGSTGWGRALMRLFLAVAVGVTWATNGLEGGTVPLTLTMAAAFVAAVRPLKHRGQLSGPAAAIIYCAFVPALLILGLYGARHGGFPQPSELP
jgi:hypothetical protein